MIYFNNPKYDMHVHTEISGDGAMTPCDFCEQALKIGLDGLCFTDHFDDYGVWEDDGTVYDRQKALAQFLEAKECYGRKLNIFFGVELGQSIHDDSVQLELLKEMPYDFVISSIHNIRGEKDFYWMDFSGVSREHAISLYERYLDELYELAGWCHYDVMGHINYPLRYFYENDILIDERDYEEQMRAILKRLIENDIGIEVNFRSMRMKMAAPQPAPWVVHLYKELGGTKITYGSDAHKPEQLGFPKNFFS